ncbi:hypothetical protein A2777_02815 [Candidatus Gottesmanbacteria bacterium RIFCSPHIGHO2_01_FULL_40_15]|uniref:Glycosyl transferase family 1 domain-containing protein n=1 Tax=Candidatus Gottesmanbacteria bacterium RIFCSPHIGHO2_01_FULL_40_15 TaxID=1798376 RepID=A0A1F5Z7K7_9BACT|nr:MAG: hypothetical protein A2777_02815 [Candidatus Gottesmanbacteria bacterium RIFCSPHIGHO2_01_FULL_40_15]
MKIAVVHNVPPGGLKRALFEQVKRLSESHQVDTFTFSSTNDSFFSLRDVSRNYITVDYKYPDSFPLSIISVYWNLRHAYRKMAELINKGKYHVAYVNPCFLTQAPYVLRYLKIPSLYFCPELRREFYENIPRVTNKITYGITYPFRLFIKKIDIDNVRRADLIVSLSKYMQEKIKKIYKRDSQVISLGADPDKFTPIDIPKNNTVFTVGGLNLMKGHDFLIRSLAKIDKTKRPGLVIAGFGGHERNYIRKLAGNLNVSLEIFDNPSDEELNKLYNSSRLFLYAAHSEPFGLVVLEALSAGVKVVAVNEGGIPEIINQKYLGTITDRDENKFAGIVKKELEKKENTEIALKRRQYILNNWNWDNSVEDLLKLLQIAAVLK